MDTTAFLHGYLLKSAESMAGGLADKKPDSKYDPEQVAEGIETELEHTDDIDEAKEIAKDHLEEIPDYYERLEEMEEEAEGGEEEEED